MAGNSSWHFLLFASHPAFGRKGIPLQQGIPQRSRKWLPPASTRKKTGSLVRDVALIPDPARGSYDDFVVTPS
jgi:hypothetical protein